MVGIISNNAALFAQRNLATASADSSSSIAKLSSGERIISASDDVAGLAVGTSLQTTVSTLRTVLGTTNQASSLLQIADGGLSNITDILSRQKALAVSANSGSLSDTERAFLQQEFSALTSEIDRIVGSTEFNGIKLIDGSVSGDAGLTSATTDGSFSLSAGTDYIAAEDTSADNTYAASVLEATSVGTAVTFAVAQDGGTRESNVSTFAAIPSAGVAETLVKDFATEDLDSGDSFSLDGITFTIGAGASATTGIGTTAVGLAEDLTATQFADQIAAAINSGGGGTVTAASDGAGELTLTSVALGDVTTFDALNALEGGAGGLGTDVVVTDGSAADTIEINNNTFTFVASGEATTSTQINLGADLAGTLDNIVQALNDGSTGAQGAEAGVSDFTYTNDGVSSITAIADADANGGVAAEFTGGTVGTQVHTTGILSADVTDPTYQSTLQGAITNISANFIASDADNNARVQLSAEVGGVTYLSDLVDLGANNEVTADQAFTFTSQAATGATDLTFAINVDDALATAVSTSSQTEATAFADSLQSDLDGTGFVINQSREISSFTAANVDGTALAGLTAADVTIVAEAFDTAGGFGSLGAFDVDTANNRISTTIDGEVYTADLTAYAGTYDDTTKVLTTDAALSFTSATDTDARSIDIALTSVTAATIDLSSDAGQAALEGVLNGAFDIGGGSGLTFQVGVDATDNIGVTIAGANTTTLFVDGDGASVSLDISSAGLSGTENGGDGTGSILASNVIDRALNAVTGLRAEVGALQSRFNFASSNISSAIQNTDAARSNFLDVDVADESTNFATAQVRLQASISVLAQANQLPQNLLKLIG
jgi:flagellin